MKTFAKKDFHFENCQNLMYCIILFVSHRTLTENLQVAFIAPDTSPRGVRIEGDSDSWDFGVGAGFYIDAKEEPWNKHYRMYSYIVEELPAFLAQHFHCLDLSR